MYLQDLAPKLEDLTPFEQRVFAYYAGLSKVFMRRKHLLPLIKRGYFDEKGDLTYSGRAITTLMKERKASVKAE